LFFYKFVFLLKEDGTCPDVPSACGEGADSGGRRSTCGEGATPWASEERENRVQPCRCYPSLPEAIAPSLASTPTFARRDTAWCHAHEVCIYILFKNICGVIQLLICFFHMIKVSYAKFRREKEQKLKNRIANFKTVFRIVTV
jgi:hypothetical protein